MDEVPPAPDRLREHGVHDPDLLLELLEHLEQVALVASPRARDHGAHHVEVRAGRSRRGVVGGLLEEEAGRPRERRMQPGRELLAVEDRRRLVRGEVEAEPRHLEVRLGEKLDLAGVPVRQLPFRNDLEDVPDGQRRDDGVTLDDLVLEDLVRQDPRLACDRNALHLVVLDDHALGGSSHPDLAAVLGDGVGEVLEEAVPALLGPERVARDPLLLVVHLAHVEVVARGVVPPLVGEALEHGEELPEVDHALVARVLQHPLAQRAVVPFLELLERCLREGADHLLELVLVAGVAVADRAPRVLRVVPDRHVARDGAVAEPLAEVLEDLGDPRARVLEQVPADVELEALVRHRHPAAAEMLRLVEHEHLLAALREQRAGRQAGCSGPDHNDVHLRHRSPPPPAWTSSTKRLIGERFFPCAPLLSSALFYHPFDRFASCRRGSVSRRAPPGLLARRRSGAAHRRAAPRRAARPRCPPG